MTNPIANIQDLDIDVNAPLTVDVKKHLSTLLEAEFMNRGTKYQKETDERLDKDLCEYKKKVEFNEKVKECKRIELKKSKYEEKSGTILSELHKEYETRKDKITKEQDLKRAAMQEELDNAMYVLHSTTGMDINENVLWSPTDAKTKETVNKLNMLRQNALKPNEEMMSLKNKLLARLQFATKMGEAVVILNAVMGNDVLPTLTKSDVKSLTFTSTK